jgi:hypothetical protein
MCVVPGPASQDAVFKGVYASPGLQCCCCDEVRVLVTFMRCKYTVERFEYYSVITMARCECLSLWFIVGLNHCGEVRMLITVLK